MKPITNLSSQNFQLQIFRIRKIVRTNLFASSRTACAFMPSAKFTEGSFAVNSPEQTFQFAHLLSKNRNDHQDHLMQPIGTRHCLGLVFLNDLHLPYQNGASYPLLARKRSSSYATIRHGRCVRAISGNKKKKHFHG